MQTTRRILFGFVLFFCVLNGVFAQKTEPVAVKIDGGPGRYRLLRGGEEYFIRGVGGDRSPALLARSGGNSFRTWGIDQAAKNLDEARKLGLTVTLGYWMGHERHGFDYGDPAQRARQKEEVRRMVLRYKNHPALLIWGLGNEVELECKNEDAIWRQINELAEMVHELDPNHPVMAVVAEIPEAKVKKLHELCPAVDIIGINAYGGGATVGERWRRYGATKPYILTEFGPVGHWETAKTPDGAAIEASSTEKGLVYTKTYAAAVAAEQGKFCLGSYAFLWGTKMEGTPTWFGMLLPDGSRLAAAEAMEIAWKGKPDPDTNRVPVIEAIAVTKKSDIRAGETVRAAAKARDPDGDKLVWHWSLIAEVGYSVGGDAQASAPEFAEAVVKGQGTSSVEVQLPGGGIYRLYAYVRDGRDGAAYASEILQGEGEKPSVRLSKTTLPCEVYADDAPARWIPSGYMGDTQAIKIESDCETSPHAGATCMKVSFSATEGWGGVLWQSPANDWGDRAGGLDLSGATMLEFHARGENGGETVTIQVGGLEGKPFSDSFKTQKQELTLKKEWTRYRVALDGLDLSRVKTPFGWVAVPDGRPVTFYLDDIRFTDE